MFLLKPPVGCISMCLDCALVSFILLQQVFVLFFLRRGGGGFACYVIYYCWPSTQSFLSLKPIYNSSFGWELYLKFHENKTLLDCLKTLPNDYWKKKKILEDEYEMTNDQIRNKWMSMSTENCRLPFTTCLTLKQHIQNSFKIF